LDLSIGSKVIFDTYYLASHQHLFRGVAAGGVPGNIHCAGGCGQVIADVFYFTG
jgi:hypothetical protein